MDVPKSVAIQSSNQYREFGNQAFIKGEYYEALCNYNKSLIAAKKFELKSSMALAFGNRSAVYFKVNQYEKCLENIELARLNGYPADKIQKLEEREKKCHEMIEQKQDPDDDPKDFFKLSYEANEKISFIVNCLEIRDEAKRGRGIFTKHDLKAGDIIAIEEPFLAEMPSKHVQCAICLKQNMLHLIPGKDEKYMFCSKKCSNEFDRIPESCTGLPKLPAFIMIIKALSISGGYEELREIYANPTKQTVFDCDLSNPNDAEAKLNMLKCAVSLRQQQLNFSEKPEYAECLKTLNLSNQQRDIVLEVLYRNRHISNYNSHRLKNTNFALPIFLSLINHSCDPNIEVIHAYGYLVAIVNRPLRAGDQLLKSQIGFSFETTTKIERQQEILEEVQYMCDCTACVEDYPLLVLSRHQDPRFKMPANSFGTVKETTEELKKNWCYLSLNMKNHPSFETSTFLLRNRDLLDYLANLADCPFKTVINRIFSTY